MNNAATSTGRPCAARLDARYRSAFAPAVRRQGRDRHRRRQRPRPLHRARAREPRRPRVALIGRQTPSSRAVADEIATLYPSAPPTSAATSATFRIEEGVQRTGGRGDRAHGRIDGSTTAPVASIRRRCATISLKGWDRGGPQQPARHLPVLARGLSPVDGSARRRDRQHARRHLGAACPDGPFGRGTRRRAAPSPRRRPANGGHAGVRVNAGRAGLDRVERDGPLRRGVSQGPARPAAKGAAAALRHRGRSCRARSSIC
jgi:hypothetical protein